MKKIRCGSEYHIIVKCPKTPQDNEKRQKQVLFNEKGNRACDNGKNNSDQKINESMERMYGNDKWHIGIFGYSSQLINWILDSGATCHMTPEVSDFIPGSVEDTDEHIEVADRHCVKAKQKCQAQIKMCDENGDTFVVMLHNVLLAPYLCNSLFSITT